MITKVWAIGRGVGPSERRSDPSARLGPAATRFARFAGVGPGPRATDNAPSGSTGSGYSDQAHRSRVGSTRRVPLVDREGVTRQLLGLDAPIVSVRTPGGYGKTSTVEAWDRADARPFVWTHLDQSCNDPAHLVRHITAALLTANPGRELPTLDESLGPAEAIDQCTMLLRSAAPVVLVLDGIDHQLSPSSASVIERIIIDVPVGSQIVLSGRSSRPVPLTAHRLDGDVFDLTVADLAFSDDEARQLLHHAGVDATGTEIDDLVQRAEGWVAGLLLLARSGGADAMTRSYLEEELLADVPGPIQRFLESTSVLDTVTDETADELLSTTSSARMLHDLAEVSSVLLVPLDPAATSYRYHRLFAPLLQERLKRRDPAEANVLRRRAGEICERRADLAGAVRHAMAAGDGTLAADIVLKHAVRLVFSGHADELQRLLDLLGADAPERWIAAAVATGWCGIGRGDVTTISRALQALTPTPDVGPIADGSVSVSAAIALMRSMIAPNGVRGVVRDAEVVRLAGNHDRNPFWGLATGIQATAYAQLGEDDLARDRFAEAHPTISHLPMFAAGTLSYLAVLDLRAGDLTTAQKRASSALSIAERHHLDTLAPAVPIYAVAAMLAGRTQRRDQAQAASAIATRLLDRLGPLSARSALFAHSCLADAALHLDDRVNARDHLHVAVAAQRRDPTATQLNRDLDELLVQFEQRTKLGPDNARLTPAELKLLANMPTHLSLDEIAKRLYISHNTAKSQSVAIYRKLGVSKRRDAVAAAQQLGILPLPPATQD